MPKKRKLQHAKNPPRCPNSSDPRRCLRCSGWFCSTGKGNRQCSKCFDDSVHVSRRLQSPGMFIMGDENAAEEY